ncbi:hypothetical protein EYF80_039159 [Liparis tanakae]|uniref:Uncharacterized protein n=1 Tax=Liparis tanakae TaxID=230148 RepID=A0A4Z2GAL7_9TELE|nr:hypothetical protein EYF80_039159 [Liparis tanakae]
MLVRERRRFSIPGGPWMSQYRAPSDRASLERGSSGRWSGVGLLHSIAANPFALPAMRRMSYRGGHLPGSCSHPANPATFPFRRIKHETDNNGRAGLKPITRSALWRPPASSRALCRWRAAVEGSVQGNLIKQGVAGQTVRVVIRPNTGEDAVGEVGEVGAHGVKGRSQKLYISSWGGFDE